MGKFSQAGNNNSPASSTRATFCGGIGYKLMNNKVTYRQQFTRCGKQRCRKCKEGTGHGPYWYAYWREGSRLRSGYIGKVQPTGVAASSIIQPNIGSNVSIPHDEAAPAMI